MSVLKLGEPAGGLNRSSEVVQFIAAAEWDTVYMLRVPEPSTEDQFPRNELVVLAFNSTLMTLTTEVAQCRDLVRTVSRPVNAKADRPPDLVELGKGLNHQQRNKAEQAARNAREEFKGVLEEMYGPLDEPVVEDGYKRYPPSAEQLFALTMFNLGQANARSLVMRLIHECGDDLDVVRYAFEYAQWLNQKPRTTVLAKALLPIALSSFESMLAALMRLWFLIDQDAAGVDEKAPKMGEARQYEYTNEMFRVLVDRRISEFMRKHPEQWRDELWESLQIDLHEMFWDWDGFLEALARRNCLLHNAGIVDEEYLKRTPLKEKPSIKTPLEFPIEYFSRVLDMIESASIVLTFAWIAHFAPGAPSSPEIASERVLWALHGKRWQDAHLIASFALQGQPPDHEHDELRVNDWMARRELGTDLQSLKEEFNNWRPPEDDLRFRVAIPALFQDEAATVIALKELAEKQGDEKSVATWPLIEELAQRSEPIAQWIRSVNSRPRGDPSRPPSKRSKRRR